MKILSSTGTDDLAVVYVAEFKTGKIEFVESIQPPFPREKKWVLIISTLYGCPVNCMICDAGTFYGGKLTKEEIFSQIDFLVKKRYPDSFIPVEKFKIQFARMGEPSFNPAVLEVIKELPDKYKCEGLIPSLSTIAPSGSERFFETLLKIRKEIYYEKEFQLQFSIHTTDENLREKLVPVRKWEMQKIAEYGERFFNDGRRKITLNFALSNNSPIDEKILLKYFDPNIFLIKITPLNPTYQGKKNKLTSYINVDESNSLGDTSKYEIIKNLKNAGYDVILSIGEAEENFIGSNCGQYILKHLEEKEKIKDGYTYQSKDV